MNDMISVARGFQYSVNIGYDLNDDDKLKNFIPTNSSLKLLESVLLSTAPTSTDRARILIGPYGKGKSHIVLTILSILMKKDLDLFEKLLPKIEDNERLNRLVRDYYESDNKILPVIISGSNTSLSQAFLLALQRTLSENQLMDVMPDTNYQAAINTIERWETEYPETYERFKGMIGMPVREFVDALDNFDAEKYKRFEDVYPSLTSGSVFNPFVGFDVIDLYESTVKNLKKAGYTGIYVVYDEFSKYLETNIADASVSDTKMLQDFAEKCNRSGGNQLHIMLISHKEISNYIDKLPKSKVDGWRGVSERFYHVHLNNNFTQTYEIIASVIQKNKEPWADFCARHSAKFDEIVNGYCSHPIFSDMSEMDTKKVVYACYPLHPVSTFVLPRLSERVAQNERTLFTFLSSNGISTLPSFLNECSRGFYLITPDVIYDYFEPLLRKESYSGELYRTYNLAEVILDKIQGNDLECKIVKTIALIYMLEQFERLKPTRKEIVDIFRCGYSADEIDAAIRRLIRDEYVIYHKKSNDYLQLKRTSGVDVEEKIRDTVESQRYGVSLKSALNEINIENYVYPSRYNYEKEMTRFFSFVFIDESEVEENTDWDLKSGGIEADGVIYALIPSGSENIENLKRRIIASSKNSERCVFIVPKRFSDIESSAREYYAARALRDAADDDRILFDEYDVICQDLLEVIDSFICSYTRPEKLEADYIYNGQTRQIYRKAALAELLSQICNELFCDTPVVNNESINKMNPTSVAVNSRNKVVAALLRNELEENLGFVGNGQEVTMMRSTLVRTGVLINRDGKATIELSPDGNEQMRKLLFAISDFVVDAGKSGDKSMRELYDVLTLPKHHIGVRKGIIPIYVAAVFHEHKRQIVIYDQNGQKPLNADTLTQINADPTKFWLSYLGWDAEKENYIAALDRLFSDYVIEEEKSSNSYEYVVSAMNRWYLSLPKYVKDAAVGPNGDEIPERERCFLKNFKGDMGGKKLLFENIPQGFGRGEGDVAGLADEIEEAKRFFDGLLDELEESLILGVKRLFASGEDDVERASLSSIVKDWCDGLSEAVFEQLFPNGADRVLALFKTATNDEEAFISKLSKVVSGLRMEDWNDETAGRFMATLAEYKKTAEDFRKENCASSSGNRTETYLMSFLGENGEEITKRFDKVESSKRGELLKNAILAQIDSMGQSISEQEKRQVLMEILKDMS